jgi:GMP synthase (glutamine-hydrolysing)
MPMLVVDNLSPFTPDILACLGHIGIPYVYKKFSELNNTDLDGSEKVILSGRRRSSKQINATNSRIIRQCHDDGKPLLGICYGAEIIALTLGGTICKLPAHVQGMMPVTVSGPNPLTEGKQLISVYESHGYCIARLPTTFETLASSQYCKHEIFVCGDIYGTQFHPEKSGLDGLTLLQNFAKL